MKIINLMMGKMINKLEGGRLHQLLSRYLLFINRSSHFSKLQPEKSNLDVSRVTWEIGFPVAFPSSDDETWRKIGGRYFSCVNCLARSVASQIVTRCASLFRRNLKALCVYRASIFLSVLSFNSSLRAPPWSVGFDSIGTFQRGSVKNDTEHGRISKRVICLFEIASFFFSSSRAF